MPEFHIFSLLPKMSMIYYLHKVVINYILHNLNYSKVQEVLL